MMIELKNKRIGLKTKLIASAAFVIVVTIFVLGVFFTRQQKALILSNLELKAIDMAENLAYNSEYYILTENMEELDSFVKGVMKHPDVAYCIISNAREGILASGGIKKEHPDVFKGLGRGRFHGDVVSRLLDSRGEEYLEAKATVYAAGSDLHQDELGILVEEAPVRTRIDPAEASSSERIGLVRVGVSTLSAVSQIRRGQRTIILIAIVIILCAAGVTVYISGLILKPVKALIKGTQEISKGDLNYKVEIKVNDEFGDLANSFNEMGSVLKKSTVSMEVLKEAQKRFEDIAKATGDWIWEVDMNGRYVYSSTVSKGILGYLPSEIVGKYFYDFCVPESREEIKKVILDVFSRREKIKDLETHLVCKDGSIVIVETSGMPILNKFGDLLGYRGVDRDVTARKEAERVLLESVKIKSDFTSMVSHELRTPLTAIKEGIAIVLEEEAGSLNDEQKDFLSTAKRNVDRLSRLINSVLDFTKLESGKVDLKTRKNSIKEAIQEVISTYKVHAEEKGLYLSVEVPDDLPMIGFDFDRIIQVLTNLVNNAIKFTETGGVTIRASRQGDKIVVSVRDTGVGIKADGIEKLFEEFHQVEDSALRKTGGTGLGLAISKRIIAQHGGRIWVESEYGAGATFFFELELERKPKILVVDDDEVVIRFYYQLLGKKGYIISDAQTGKEAIKKAQEGEFDLIILDMCLPDINGYEVIGRLRSQKLLKNIPVLAVSGYEEGLRAIDSLPPGPDGEAMPGMSKPFDNELFLKAIRSILRQID